MNVLILKSAKFSTSTAETLILPYCLQSTSGQYCSHLRCHTQSIHQYSNSRSCHIHTFLASPT